MVGVPGELPAGSDKGVEAEELFHCPRYQRRVLDDAMPVLRMGGEMPEDVCQLAGYRVHSRLEHEEIHGEQVFQIDWLAVDLPGHGRGEQIVCGPAPALVHEVREVGLH